MNKQEIIDTLFANHLPDVQQQYRLNSKDIVRLASYINSDPFSETECCKWNGAISKSSHQSKYINFWFNKKKQALHRILYLNYRGELSKNKYLRFKCNNSNMRGICCNINHLELINKDNDLDSDENNKKQKKVKNINNKSLKNEIIYNTNDSNMFVIVFDDN